MYSQSNSKDPLAAQNLIYKQFYKQQLDDIVMQKNEQKRLEREK